MYLLIDRRKTQVCHCLICFLEQSSPSTGMMPAPHTSELTSRKCSASCTLRMVDHQDASEGVTSDPQNFQHLLRILLLDPLFLGLCFLLIYFLDLCFL